MKHSVKNAKAVYVHIPFCTNKCYYCDFNSFVLKGQPVMDYLRALDKEMELTVKEHPPHEIETVFIGGGTPTVLLPQQMEYLLQSIRTYFPNQSLQMEFTVEANPGTTEMDKLEVMKSGGVNRISFGVQSFDNELLSAIGRIHTTDDVHRSIEAARKAGFTNLSIDLMFGLPNQTVDIFDDTLDKALALDLSHYSVYSLKVEENTLFHTLYAKDQLPLPDEEEELQMYLLVMRRLKEAGYEQYEISNFAKPGFASRHNTTYWKNRYYYGLGAGAHGYVNGKRHINIKGIQEYIEGAKQGLPRVESTEVTTEEAMEDFMMVGLRMMRGVSRSDFYEQFNRELEEVFEPQIDKLMRTKLLEPTEEGYRLSEQGILLGNEAFAEFLR